MIFPDKGYRFFRIALYQRGLLGLFRNHFFIPQQRQRRACGTPWHNRHIIAIRDPVVGIDAAVTRRTLDGANPNGWIPQERISLEESLLAYTSAAARSGYMEERVGTIEPGKLADLAVLSENIFLMDEKELGSVRVDLTVVEGEVVYERPAGGA